MILWSCYWSMGLRLVHFTTILLSVVMVTQPSEDAVENNCPLHISCYNGHTDIVMLLVNHRDIKINQQVRPLSLLSDHMTWSHDPLGYRYFINSSSCCSY